MVLLSTSGLSKMKPRTSLAQMFVRAKASPES